MIRNSSIIPNGKSVRNVFIFLMPPSVAFISMAELRTMIVVSEIPLSGFSLVLLMPGPVARSS